MTHHPPKTYADALAVTIPSDRLLRLEAAVRDMARGLNAAAEQIREAAETAARALVTWHRAIERQGIILANTTRNVAGLEGRYLIRAGHAVTEEDLIALVTSILDGTAEGCRYLLPESRERVVASALYGWGSGYRGEGPPVLAWHRDLGGTHVLVGRAA